MRAVKQPAARRAVVILAVIVIASAALAFIAAASEVNYIRDDFCAWATVSWVSSFSTSSTTSM